MGDRGSEDGRLTSSYPVWPGGPVARGHESCSIRGCDPGATVGRTRKSGGPERFSVNDEAHRVLVVEDDPALREVYAGSLSEIGHAVRTAADGEAALSQLGNGWKPCVIFLDLRMPGMDGWEFAQRLRAEDRWKEIPIVVVAAHFRIDHEARQVGAAAWLQKPFDLKRLDEQIQMQCLEGSTQANV